MNGKHIRFGFSIQWAALASAALCLAPRDLRAQETIEKVSFSLHFSKIDLEYGQTLRLNFTYAVDPQANPLPQAIRILANVKDAAGDTYYEIGGLPQFPFSAEISNPADPQRAKSVLIYSVYASGASSGN